METETEMKVKEESEDPQATYSKIDFNKETLFFYSNPNTIAFDSVNIKNTGKTCIYFKWQKRNKPFALDVKKSDGIDRFFCHYSDSKIFPDEEKSFVFSYFSEKNGVFSEDWILATSPPLKNCNLSLHLNGMTHLYVDVYSKAIEDLNYEVRKEGIKTSINEVVLDLVETIKESTPPLPDMRDPKVFQFYFNHYNKERNLIFSTKLMNDLLKLINQIFKALGVNEENRFWNGSIADAETMISKLTSEEDRYSYGCLLKTALNYGRKVQAEDSLMYNFIKGIFIEELNNMNDTANVLKEEYLLPPYVFDIITREGLTEQELVKYKADLTKKRDDFNKKSKKKPFKNVEEEQAEQAEYKQKLADKLKQNILNKLSSCESEEMIKAIEQKVLLANNFDEEYIERLSRIKTIKSVKNDGGVDNKYVVLRLDIETFKKEYINEQDEEGNSLGMKFKGIDFLKTKDHMLESLIYLLNNGVKAVLLIVDFGPKLGYDNPEYSLFNLKQYLEESIDHSVFFAKNLAELQEYNQKIEDEELKDNCCIVFENINFMPVECGFEQSEDEVLNPSNLPQPLSLYQKEKFIELLSAKCAVYINDSIFSFENNYPSSIDLKVPIRAAGSKIEEQLKKITDFFSINSKDYMLIIGNNDSFKVKGRNYLDMINDDFGESFKLEIDGTEALITNLLIINSAMVRFREIHVYGLLALHFIQFLRKDEELFASKYKSKPCLYQLMKYILVKAHLLGIKVVLPVDFKILEAKEYAKYLEPMYDSQGFKKSYFKEIKQLEKRERLQRQLEKTYTDEDELNENADYVRIKLEEEQIEHLKLYKEKTLKINQMPYCFDFVQEFSSIQGISKPRKVFKTPMEIYTFYQMVFEKEIIYPAEVIEASEAKHRAKEDYEKKLKEEEALLLLQQQQQQNPLPNQASTKQGLQSSQLPKETKDSKDTKPKEEPISDPIKPAEEEKPMKKKDFRFYDFDKFELVDYGEETYANLVASINKMNGILWLGTLSPNKVENIFSNYHTIVNAINQRKKFLKEKFDEDQATQEKKLNETDLRARKVLLNVFLKSASAYENVKDIFKTILNTSANPLEDLGEEEEVPQDEEQFNHDLHVLVDYYINDEFELINSILKGKHIPGFYGVNSELPQKVEEEFDPKILDDII